MGRSIKLIEQNIEAEKANLAKALGEAKLLHARLNGMLSPVNSRGISRTKAALNEAISVCRAADNPLPFSWGDEGWNDYQPDEKAVPPAYIRVSGLVEQELLLGEDKADLPLVLPLFGSDGALAIVHGNGNQQKARDSLQSLILRTALAAPGQVRFTLLDPTGLGAAFPFRDALGSYVVRASGRTTIDELGDVLSDIRRINERVIGGASRFSELSTEQRSGETFEVIVAAGFPGAYAKDPRAMEALVKIANAGPRAGRHVILEWNTQEALPHDFSSNQFLNLSQLDVGIDRVMPDTPPGGPRQNAMIQRAFDGARRQEGGDWNAIVRPNELMTESAADRISTPVGERLNFWLGESEEGKPSAHAMIAGQTGSGKSYLLHVMITGLAARYSPDEVRFTLIDGKQGVEFEAYRNFPHADVVCLRSAPALARSVLADFVSEMEDRYERFQESGVVKLGDYRTKTGESLPRRVLVVDEYQQILEGDPETGAMLLGKLLEKGRAAGMHAVLGSQTFEQRGLPQSALTHIHSWASMSLSETYSKSLQVFGSEGKRLIRELGANGEVVLNDEGGSDGANSRGAVARLRKKTGEDLLADVIEDITVAVEDAVKPIVLSGREAALVSDNKYLTDPRQLVPSATELQAMARRPVRAGGFGIETWNKADYPIPLWLGRRFDVRGHALCALRRAPGQNLLALGANTEARHRMIAAALASVGALLKNDALEVTYLSGLRDEMPGSGMIDAGLNKLGEAGVSVRKLAIADMEKGLQKIAKGIDTRKPKAPSHLVVIAEPDYLNDLHGGADRFNAPKKGPTVSLRKILTHGPQVGVHVLFTASGLTTFQLVLSPTREITVFNHVVAQQMNEEDSMSLFSSLMGARLNERADHPFTTLHVDKITGTRNATLFHSYGANRVLSADQGLDALNEELSLIRYPGS